MLRRVTAPVVVLHRVAAPAAGWGFGTAEAEGRHLEPAHVVRDAGRPRRVGAGAVLQPGELQLLAAHARRELCGAGDSQRLGGQAQELDALREPRRRRRRRTQTVRAALAFPGPRTLTCCWCSPPRREASPSLSSKLRGRCVGASPRERSSPDGLDLPADAHLRGEETSDRKVLLLVRGAAGGCRPLAPRCDLPRHDERVRPRQARRRRRRVAPPLPSPSPSPYPCPCPYPYPSS